MADANDNKGNAPEGTNSTTESIGNLKKEFDRKLTNLEEQNNRLEQLIKMSLTSTPKTVATPKVEPDVKLSDLIYTDPDRAAAIISKQATDQANQIVDQRMADRSAREQVAFQLIQEYPELNDQTSDLYKETVKVFNGLSANEQLSPSSYKLAAREAAAGLGVLPSSKRSNSDNDSYSMKGGGSGGGNGGRKSQRKNEVDPMTIEFSRLLGRDTNDPKVIEGLKKASERGAWNKYK